MTPFGNDALADLLKRSLEALGAYRDDVILVGGLVPLLYRYLPGFNDPGLSPCATRDVDLAIEARLPVRDQSVRTALEGAGLHVVEVPGIGRQIAQQYYQLDPSARLQPEHLEFLAPLRGPDRDRPVHPQPDMVAQALRFIDLLRARPLACEVPEVGRILLPHPFTYVVQKTRIRSDRRKRDKHRKDQADVAYVIWSFASSWRDWREVAGELMTANHEWRSWIRDVGRMWQQLYVEPSGPGPAEAAAAFRDSKLHVDQEVIRRVMADFLSTIA